MYLTKASSIFSSICQGPYSMCHVVSHEDDQKPNFWYFLLIDKQMQYPGTYLNFHGAISATFMLDATLKSLAVQALWTLDDSTGDITSHFIGHGKLHLPGIANSSGMKYGIVDIELSVKQFIGNLPTGASPVMARQAVEFVPISVGFGTKCDCGGHKLGYKDDELHGHGRWCKLVKDANGRQTKT